MMRAYDPAAWVPFFTAMIAAAAGLTGLLFVAVSINLDRILKGARFLPARAAETLATLLLVVVSSALALVPQSTRLLGLEILIVVVPMLVITVRSQLTHRRQNRDDPLLWTVSRMAGTAAATVPCTVAGVSLALHGGGGFYWLALAALLGTVGAVYNAWVLLVEIVR
jgi:modulator of FtsH protease